MCARVSLCFGMAAVELVFDGLLSQPAAVGGVKDEFVFSARLDNLMMTYTALTVRARSAADL